MLAEEVRMRPDKLSCVGDIPVSLLRKDPHVLHVNDVAVTLTEEYMWWLLISPIV